MVVALMVFAFPLVPLMVIIPAPPGPVIALLLLKIPLVTRMLKLLPSLPSHIPLALVFACVTVLPTVSVPPVTVHRVPPFTVLSGNCARDVLAPVTRFPNASSTSTTTGPNVPPDGGLPVSCRNVDATFKLAAGPGSIVNVSDCPLDNFPFVAFSVNVPALVSTTLNVANPSTACTVPSV